MSVATGMVLGGLLGGRICDLLGRKRTMLSVAAGYAAFAILSGTAQTLLWLDLVRFLLGVNRKRVQRLAIVRPGQVYSTDITYIRVGRGFAYLNAVIDWYSRKVLAWRLSNTMDTTFCVEALGEALATYGPPEIFNTDRGSQFTGEAFTQVLKEHKVRISMDGKGRALDNIFVERLWRSVKYEEVVCYERSRCKAQWLRSFTGDEGRSLEVGVRARASNRHKLRLSRVTVVSVAGKGGGICRQVGNKETNASEPLMTCRNVQTGVETGALTSAPLHRLGGNPLTAPLAPGMKAA